MSTAALRNLRLSFRARMPELAHALEGRSPLSAATAAEGRRNGKIWDHAGRRSPLYTHWLGPGDA